MKNKILIDAERTRYLSGISFVCRYLIKGLYQSQNKDFDFSVYADESSFQKKYVYKKWKFWHKFFHNGLSAYDLVHIFHQGNDYFPTKFKAKKVVTLHDLNFFHENLPEKKVLKNLKKVQKNLNNADGIVCISEFVKKDLLEKKHFFDFKPSVSIEVIHNGLEFQNLNENFSLKKFNNLKSKRYILNIGVLFPKKNQFSLVKMLEHLDVDLVLVVSESKKKYENEIAQFAQEYQLSDRIHIFRNISEDDKFALIQNCEAMCHPSIAEGFGIPPIEAMSFGKPVFLSKFTSLPEIGGDYAFYFEDFEPKKMAELYCEKIKFYNDNKEELIPKIKNWTEQFDYKVMSRNYLNFYKKILSK